MIYGVAGPGGSLGECQVCGKNFLLEVLTGDNIRILSDDAGVKIAVHIRCAPALQQAQTTPEGWRQLPQGPLRRAIESAQGTPETQAIWTPPPGARPLAEAVDSAAEAVVQ